MTLKSTCLKRCPRFHDWPTTIGRTISRKKILTILWRKNRWSTATTIQQPKSGMKKTGMPITSYNRFAVVILWTGKIVNTVTWEIRAEQLQEYGSKNQIKHEKLQNSPTMMMNDKDDGWSFPGRCTKKFCRENLNSDLLILVYEPFQLWMFDQQLRQLNFDSKIEQLS